MSIHSSTSQDMEDDWWIYSLPLEVEDDELYSIAPQALIEHADGEENRELVKEINEDSITYRVRSRVEYSEDDPTQSTWEKEYGVEFFLDGLARKFMNVRKPVSDPESYAGSIAEDIFPKLEAKTSEYYASKRGLDSI